MALAKKNVSSEDRRKHTRKTCSISLSYAMEHGSYKEGSILDISAGGALIKTDEDLSVGQKILLNIKYLSVLEPFIVKGRVVTKTMDGVGLEFESLPSHLKDILNFIMW